MPPGRGRATADAEVTGGSDGDQALCSGEVFNPSTQTWEEKT